MDLKDRHIVIQSQAPTGQWFERIIRDVHMHCCVGCGRQFYICTPKDCAVAPTVCLGCEMDERDKRMTRLENEAAKERR